MKPADCPDCTRQWGWCPRCAEAREAAIDAAEQTNHEHERDHR